MRQLTLATRLGAAATAALLLAGCTAAGGGEGSSASPSPTATQTIAAVPDPNHVDPCTLITAQDFDEWPGTPEMTEGKFVASLSGDGRSICRWTPKSEELSVPKIQVLLNWEYADLAEQRQLAEDIGAKTEDITIEGAEAAYSAYGGRTIGMTVGEYYVQVSYTRPTAKTKDVLKACKHFATIIASRLA